MKILIISSTHKEISQFKNFLTKKRVIDHQLTRYTYKKTIIDILVTGEGNFSFTYNLTKTLLFNHYRYAFNVGFAGSFDHLIDLGLIVNVESQQFVDTGFEKNGAFYSLFDKELIDFNQPPFHNGKLKNPTKTYISAINALPRVKGVTTGMITNSKPTLDKRLEKFNPHIESTVGAYFFYCCLLEKVRFYEIKAVSHYVDLRNIDNWNLQFTIYALSEFLTQAIVEINEKTLEE